MAKHGRPSNPARGSSRPIGPAVNPAGPPVGQADPAPAIPQRRTTYFEAVALYERGLDALQRHEYDRASNLFSSVLEQYPEEKELQERVRLYLNVCERQAIARKAAPETIDERLYAATLAINGGN